MEREIMLFKKFFTVLIVLLVSAVFPVGSLDFLITRKA